MAKKSSTKHVVVTTDRRLVMQGELESYDSEKKTAKLKNARNCIYWSPQVRGVFGLASHGPDSRCRVGRAVPSIQLEGITSITQCTPAAVAAWESEPWRQN